MYNIYSHIYQHIYNYIHNIGITKVYRAKLRSVVVYQNESYVCICSLMHFLFHAIIPKNIIYIEATHTAVGYT